MLYKRKVFKLLAKYFPLNEVRVWALRQAGYYVGNQVYIGEELHITDDLSRPSATKLIIGDRVAIAQRVTIILASDPNWSILRSKVQDVRGEVRIESDAWIGAGVIILPNVTIGEQAIVGTGSIVTRDVPSKTVVAGNPAKSLRKIVDEKNNSHNFVLLNIEDECWGTFVHSHPSANAFHHPAWARLISECYGYRSFVYAITDEDSQIQAGVPFVDFKSRLTGHRWVSLPYSDFCQPLSNSPIALEQLVDGLMDIYQEQKIPTIELRWTLPQRSDISCRSEFVMHTLSLSTDVGSVFKRFRKSHRYELRKADPDQVQVVKVENRCDFNSFYNLQTQTRQRLGVPVQPKKFFDLVWEDLIRAGLGFALIAYHNKEPISGAVFLNFNDTVIYKYSASDDTYWKLFPNKLLLWYAIQLCCEKGYKIFNFGNSPSNNSGLREFKMGWGSTETDLFHSYIGSMPIKSQDGKSKEIMTSVIRHSPRVVCRFIGELLYKHFG